MTPCVILIRNAAYHDFGGGERFPVFVAKELKKQGYQPLLVTRSPTLLKFSMAESIKTIRGWWWQQQQWSGKRIVFLPVYIAWQLVLFFWYLQLFLRIRPQAVHIQSKDDFIAATIAARVCHARVIWTDHADLKHIWRNIQKPLKNPIGKLVYFAAFFAHAITVVSKSELREVSAHLSKKSQAKQKLTVIYNGCFDQKEHYTTPSNPAIFTFCSINRLVTDKGIGEMITAFTAFHKNHPDSKLLLIGDGPEADKFKKQAGKNTAVEFLGYQSDPLPFVAKSDVFLQPSYHEGFSVAIIEAVMLEKPIVVTSVGGNTEIITDRESGLVIPARDSSALLAAMEELFANEKLRHTLAHTARLNYVKHFQFDHIVKERFIPLYENTFH